MAMTHMQSDLAATDTTPTFSGSNSGFDVYLEMALSVLSEMLSLSKSRSWVFTMGREIP